VEKDMSHRVTELHNIMPIDNVSSVLAQGIVSYERAQALQHASVALMAVQERRDNKLVPGGLRLHQYANLYFVREIQCSTSVWIKEIPCVFFE
jgi:hypothetical protein